MFFKFVLIQVPLNATSYYRVTVVGLVWLMLDSALVKKYNKTESQFKHMLVRGYKMDNVV